MNICGYKTVDNVFTRQCIRAADFLASNITRAKLILFVHIFGSIVNQNGMHVIAMSICVNNLV